jgi:hypothetical protein
LGFFNERFASWLSRLVKMVGAHFGAPAPSPPIYSGVEATGIDGATLTAACVPAEADGAAAGEEATGTDAAAAETGAAALVSI